MIHYIVFASSISSAVAALCCAIIGGKLLKHYSKPLTLFAVGFLISLSVTHIIPESMEMADTHNIGLVILAALLSLTAFEMLVSSGQSHEHKNHNHYSQGSAAGILIGSALHTFCDGLVIASAFLSSSSLGLAVTVAVLSHEVAHELGDYAIMLNLGMNTKKAFIVNIVAFLGCVAGGISGYYILSVVQSMVPYALALSGASFIYVSLSDLLPRLRHSENKRKSAIQFTWMALGVVLALVIASHD